MKKYSFSTDFLIYSVSLSLSPIINILILPVITSRFDPDTYGNYSYYLSLAGLVISLFLSWIPPTVSRYLNNRNFDYLKNKAIIIFITIVLVSLTLIVVACINFFIRDFLFLYIAVSIIFQNITNVLFSYYKTNGNSRMFGIHNICRTILRFGILLTIFQIGIFRIELLLLGNLIYDFLLLVFLVKSSSFKITGYYSIDKTKINEILKFGLPLIGLGIGGLLLDNGDRLVIKNLLVNGDYYLGIYSINYSVYSQVIVILITVFMSILPSILYPIYDNEGVDKYISELRKYLSLYLCIATCGSIYIFMNYQNISYVLMDTKYFINSNLPVLLVIGYIFYGLYQIAGNYFIVIKKTMYLNYLVLFSAFVNILLNVLFVSVFGYEFAAISTLITFFISFIIVNLMIYKRINYMLMNKRHVYLVVINLFIIALSYIIKFNTISSNKVYIILFLILTAVLIFLSPVAYFVYYKKNRY